MNIYVYAFTFVMHAHIFMCIYKPSPAMNIVLFLYFLSLPICDSKKSENFRSPLFYTDSPQFTIVQLKIFQFHDGTKAICIQEKPCSKFWILIFSGVVIGGVILCRDAGQGWQAAPRQPCDPARPNTDTLTTLLYPDNRSALFFQYGFQ